MERSAAPSPLEGHLTPAQGRLLAAHRERVPGFESALPLLSRWAETAGLPEGESPFLHLLYLAGSSEALFLALMRHPQQLHYLSAQVRNASGLGPEGMDEALARFLLTGRFSPSPEALSAFRSVQTARILLQDVLGILPFEAVTRELSSLADVLVARAFALTYQPLRESLGLPLRAARDGRLLPCPLCVFALGKLGGNELNYASDVDLVFFYAADGQTDEGNPNGAFFSAWVQAATAFLTAPTPYGACLRVDANLRPRGRDGELTLSFPAALSYYREWADLWERQAWLRARPCAGDLEEGARFLRLLEPILFKAYSWSGIASQVRRLRERSLARLARVTLDEPERNVKEGRGGIRDAEFAVQALQLAHGQQDRWVREGHTLLATERLRQRGVLADAQRASLARGYTLLRRAEHWAQFQHMRQTHRLPASPAEWESLARYLHMPSVAEAQESLAAARRDLAELFQRALDEVGARDSERDALSVLLSPEGMADVLRQGGLPDPDRALPLLSSIYGALDPYLDRPSRRQNFLRVHHSLLREFQAAPDPYAGLQALSGIVASFAGERWAATALLDQPRLARLLFRLVSRSAPLLETVQRWPSLVRLLDYPRLRGVEGLLSGGEEGSWGQDELRRWHKEALFLMQSRELLMGEDLAWSQRLHTRLADLVCERVFLRACEEVETAEELKPGTLPSQLCLLGLGRLGFGEMHPRSDLDLVCVKRGAWLLPSDPHRSSLVEARFSRALAGAFTAMTRHGALYDVDFRLRPYGQSGPQVQSVDALREYFAGPAQLWERLAYLKGRPVAGDRSLGAEALALVWALAFERGAPEEEIPALLDLRRRLEVRARDLESALKFFQGGLLDLDLVLLVLQARHRLDPAPGGTPGLIGRLEGAWALPPTLKADLGQARLFQDTLLHRSRLHLSRPPALGYQPSALTELGRLWASSSHRPEEIPRPEKIEEVWKGHRKAVARSWDQVRSRGSAS